MTDSMVNHPGKFLVGFLTDQPEQADFFGTEHRMMPWPERPSRYEQVFLTMVVHPMMFDEQQFSREQAADLVAERVSRKVRELMLQGPERSDDAPIFGPGDPDA